LKKLAIRGGAVLLGLILVLLVTAALYEWLTFRDDRLASHRFEHDGRQRAYHLYLPAANGGAEGKPLVVALHRFAETGKRMSKLTGFTDLAEEAGFAVVYPEGVGRRWNTRMFGPDTIDDVGYIDALTKHLVDAYSLDANRVYLTGASNGGFMTYLLAAELPGAFAAVAPVMATMPESVADIANELCAVPIMIVHGTKDPVVPYDGWEVEAGPNGARPVLPIPDTARFWAKLNRAAEIPGTVDLADTVTDDGTRVTRDEYAGENPVVELRILGGGHTWPGGEQLWPRFIVGRISRDVNATEMIWEFFQRFPATATDVSESE
jgi:polyhydroxybutyrate depolymerase